MKGEHETNFQNYSLAFDAVNTKIHVNIFD